MMMVLNTDDGDCNGLMMVMVAMLMMMVMIMATVIV